MAVLGLLMLSLPWVVFLLFVVLRMRLPIELTTFPVDPRDPPFVTVIVPARDEERNIERVLRSLASSRYPAFEILVVDDRSSDRTAELACSVAPGQARRLEVIRGEPLPGGWLGKPWACWQGVQRAHGDLLLFTDADTVHGAELLSRSVRELREREADALTVLGRQLLETFWERLIQPQIFLTMMVRFADARRPRPSARWRSAIANGQYLLFRREVYEALDGHRGVREEVVEDQALAQRLVRGGYRLWIGRAEDQLATRMYESLGEIIAGWSKNLVLGGLRSLSPWTRPVAPALLLLTGATLWLLPPLVLVGALVGPFGGVALTWSTGVVVGSTIFWAVVGVRMGVPGLYGALYPLGAAAAGWIVLRSWLRMESVVWKGREYHVKVGDGGSDS
jgi:chlorobactene glucosyltransferase